MLKLRSLGLAIVAVAALFAGAKADAGLIVGSQAFASLDITTNPDAANLGTAVTLDLRLNTTTNSQTGDFDPYPIAFIDNTVLNTASLSSFTFGSADFGFFTATSGLELSSAADTRTFSFDGNFTPGSNAVFAGLSANTASALLSFTQSGGAGNAISLSWTLNTPSLNVVPEPSSMAIWIPAVLGVAYWLRRRRR